MPNDQGQDGDLSNSNEDYSVRGAANHCIWSPNTDSGPGHIHEPVSYHGSPNAASQTINPSSSSSNRKKSHHQKRKPKRTRSSVSEMTLSLTALSICSDVVATSSSPSRQRIFSRTQASSTLTNISNVPSLTPTTNIPPPQFTFVPVESDVPTCRSNVNAAEDLNPFSASPLPSHPISVMFPSFSSAIDAVLEDNSFNGIQVEIDALGCAILSPSEYTLSLESEYKFHYSFWDSYNQIHFCVPVDLALRLDPLRASLYDDYPLALPPISQVAVRFSTVACQTRFSRLVPKPTQPALPSSSTTAPQQQPINTIPTTHPSQPYIITYRGAAVGYPSPLHTKSDKDKLEITIAKGIHLSSGWERIVDVDGDSCPSPRKAYQGLHKGRKHGAGEDAEQGKEEQVEEGKRGFSIRAWIPVPVSLFANKETCTFRVEARLGIEDPFSLGVRRFGRPGVRWDVGSFDDEPKPSDVVCPARMLEASAEVTVSHLHSTKEMV